MSKLAEQLRESIEEDIATGKLGPGVHLDEMQLAAAFGVSRTPVREALNLLAGEGLVEARPRRGTVVAALSPERLVEMFEVMGELEAMCARLAARRMTNAEQHALEGAHLACEAARAADDTDAYFYANEAFHHLIYAGSQNRFLAEQASALHRKLRPYRRLQLRVRNRMSRSFDEHAAIVAAIRAGDSDGVVAQMREHVLVQGERFSDLLSGLRTMQESAHATGRDGRDAPRAPRPVADSATAQN